MNPGPQKEGKRFVTLHRQPHSTTRFLMLSSTALSIALLLSAITPVLAQIADPDAKPSPSSIGTDIPVTYQGPPPSEVQKEYIGPYQLLKSGTMDQTAGTITLPLYRGQMRDGRKVWYILTDTTDKANADALGLNFSAKLNYARVGKGARVATLETDESLTFESGTVDFKPERKIVPGDAPNFFPPKSAQPGSVGDMDYSPLVRIQNSGDNVYNAPIVAFDEDDKQISFCDGHPDYSLVHDRIAKICPDGNGGGTVTIKLTPIYSFARPSLYMSMDASDPVVAALDAGTLAPSLSDIGVGRDDGAFSAVERLFVIANGPMGKDNPQRQGLNSALGDGPLADGRDRPPLNVIGGIPTVATDYSPVWDLNLGEWTKDAISKGYRARVFEEFAILGLVQQGFITGPMGKKFGSTGIVVNCPIVFRFL